LAVLLIRYAEIGLKSAPVRARFERQLKDNILNMLAEDGVEALVTKRGARYYVEATDPQKAVESVRKVFGVASISVAETCSSDLEEVCRAAAEFSVGKISEGQSFAVDARREGSHNYTSMDLGREAGSAIFLKNEHLGIRVDLTKPDVKFFVEVRENLAYIFLDYIRCHAGLPIGTQGRIIADTSDDRGLVSAWLMMKRGCRVLPMDESNFDVLKRYDPGLRVRDRNNSKRAIAISLGTDLASIESLDFSQYDLPVFYPSIGMTDSEVSNLAGRIRSRF